MTGLLIIFVLLAIGFAAGYGTRELISRKRHAEYLHLQPYISPALRPKQSSSDERTKTLHAASEPPMAERRRTNHDITRSFQDISIHDRKPENPARPAGGNLHLVQAHRPEPDAGSLQPANFEQSLEELVALLQRRRQDV
ncbi:hypothetical protein IVA80_05590 [Bradyrhizobium sp. 139]|uniref:hypothetical protein n=1 Tax=Bradyrhizobium sp. 139 TaxID=2782616 RepID=UPI001FFAB002|nr:hypothetical protein [Bradyrhizobium sp. 139]MCK1740349.1 hypothetical protein [Bradyrhizobium sp. 139]